MEKTLTICFRCIFHRTVKKLVEQMLCVHRCGALRRCDSALFRITEEGSRLNHLLYRHKSNIGQVDQVAAGFLFFGLYRQRVVSGWNG